VFEVLPSNGACYEAAFEEVRGDNGDMHGFWGERVPRGIDCGKSILKQANL
jgi:hypothetical protein